MCKRLALENLSLKDMHLPMNLSAEQLSQTAQKVRSSGVNLYGCGVVYMKTAGDVEKAFEYAKNAGIGMIIGVPSHEFLDLTEEKIKEYDIRVAIHNHGPTDKLYQSPSSAYELIKKRDSRFGLCVDLGHTRRCGIDCAEEIRKVSDRVIDVHLKDVTEAAEKGTTVEIGRGVIDMPKVLRTLREIDYQGTASFEFEKDQDDPLPGLAESVGYVRGALAVL
jgi:sugar phosphate isomerase/epimerase